MDAWLIILGVLTYASGLSLSDQGSNSTASISNVTTTSSLLANSETIIPDGILTAAVVDIINKTTELNATFSTPFNVSTSSTTDTTYEPSVSTPRASTSAFSPNSTDVADSHAATGPTKGLPGALGRLLLGLLLRRFSWAELLAAVCCSLFALAVCAHVALLIHYALRRRRKGVLRVGMATTSSPQHSDGGFESFDAPTLQVRPLNCRRPRLLSSSKTNSCDISHVFSADRSSPSSSSGMASFVNPGLVGDLNDSDTSCTALSDGFVWLRSYGDTEGQKNVFVEDEAPHPAPSTESPMKRFFNKIRTK